MNFGTTYKDGLKSLRTREQLKNPGLEAHMSIQSDNQGSWYGEKDD